MRHSKLHAIAPLVLCSACQSASEPPLVTRSDAALFEIEYVNYAWVPTWRGFYIDARGTVWSYDRSGLRGPDWSEKSSYTHDELMQKFAAQRGRVRELSEPEVRARYELVSRAAAGPLSRVFGRCADAGVFVFRAYLNDSATERYRPVLLHMEGDRAQANLAPEARQLFGWLDSLRLVRRFEGCQPAEG